MLEKSFGIVNVTVFIKPKDSKMDMRRQEDISILADELSNLLDDPLLEEILK